MMRDWLCERQPERYVRTPDGGVEIPSLDGWRTGPLESLKGLDALKTCAKLVQEELCLVREETVEDLWMSCEDGEGDDGPSTPSPARATTGRVRLRGVPKGVPRGCAAGAETARHTFEAGVVCFSFDPRKRHKKTLAQVHAPVPEVRGEDAQRGVSGVREPPGRASAVARQLGFAEFRRGGLHRLGVAPDK